MITAVREHISSPFAPTTGDVCLARWWHLDPENPYRMGREANHSGQAMDVMFEAGGKKG